VVEFTFSAILFHVGAAAEKALAKIRLKAVLIAVKIAFVIVFLIAMFSVPKFQ
jgi:hypothetical protein